MTQVADATNRSDLSGMSTLGFQQNCEGFGRRDFIQTGLGALGGLGLSQMLGMRAASAAAAGGPVISNSNMRCILIWLDGGPSHYETFDPKPGREEQGETKPIQTKTPGILFGHTHQQADIDVEGA
jgi:hypothetical protein